MDNYFDLIPGRKLEVEFRTGGPVNLADFQKRLVTRSLADAFWGGSITQPVFKHEAADLNRRPSVRRRTDE